MSARRPTTSGFKRTSTLVEKRVRKASEGRGFSQSRILTHWEEIVGPDLAAQTRPTEVRYGRGGIGATLWVLTTGASAPLIDAQRDSLREKINAVYGYNAIARIKVTQTAPTGFADGQVQFQHRTAAEDPATPPPKVTAAARETARGVQDPGLRAALERLGENVISNHTRRTPGARAPQT